MWQNDEVSNKPLRIDRLDASLQLSVLFVFLVCLCLQTVESGFFFLQARQDIPGNCLQRLILCLQVLVRVGIGDTITASQKLVDAITAPQKVDTITASITKKLDPRWRFDSPLVRK